MTRFESRASLFFAGGGAWFRGGAAGLYETELSELRASHEPLGGRVAGAEYLGSAILEALLPSLRDERQHHERQSDGIARERLERALAA